MLLKVRKKGISYFSVHKENSIEILVALLILLFFYTATNKLLDFHGFVRQMQMQVFPETTIPFIVYSLPAVELITTALLYFNRTRFAGFIISTLLMLVFTIYIGLILLGYFDRVPCACGGVLKSMSFQTHFYFNLFFLAIAIFGTIKQYKIIKTGGKL